MQSQGFSAPPYLAAYFICLFTSFISDRVNNRGFFIAFLCSVGAAGYLILNQVETSGVRYFATFLACAGVFPAVALVRLPRLPVANANSACKTFTWVTDNQGSSSKRGAGLVIFGMIGQCGPILGARLYPEHQAPMYARGMAVNAGLLFFATALSLFLSMCLRVENRKRDQKHGKVEPGHIPDDIADLGDAHPMYRFVL